MENWFTVIKAAFFPNFNLTTMMFDVYIHTSLELLFLKRHKLRARSKINIALAAGSVVACSLDDNESVIKCSDKLIYIHTYGLCQKKRNFAKLISRNNSRMQ